MLSHCVGVDPPRHVLQWPEYLFLLVWWLFGFLWDWFVGSSLSLLCIVVHTCRVFYKPQSIFIRLCLFLLV